MEHTLESYQKQFERDEFAGNCGIILTEASPGHAIAQMEVTEKHLNSVGTVHGGALFTLADFTFAVAANSREKVAMAIQAEISYFKAIRTGLLSAVAREISLHEKLGTYVIDIFTETGELVANFKGTVYRKSETLKFE
jgi:acyl-CoA thioesterase